MGKREKRELISRLKPLMVHLLKWEYQPSFQSKSWQSTIKSRDWKYATTWKITQFTG